MFHWPERGVAGPLVPIGPIDLFKGIPIVDPHLYGSAGSHFVLRQLEKKLMQVALTGTQNDTQTGVVPDRKSVV